MRENSVGVNMKMHCTLREGGNDVQFTMADLVTLCFTYCAYVRHKFLQTFKAKTFYFDQSKLLINQNDRVLISRMVTDQKSMGFV